MNRSIHKYIFGYLLILVMSMGTSLCFTQATQAQDVEIIKAGNFASGQLEAHFLKHGYQFGQITQEQYLKGAQTLLDATPGGDILEKIRYNGDIEHFRVSTGEYAVMTKKGRIRTYFKTDYGYWLRQE